MLNVIVQCMCDLLCDVVCVWRVYVNVCFVCGLFNEVVLFVVLWFPMLLSVLVCVEVQVWFVCDMLCEVAWCGVSVAVGI